MKGMIYLEKSKVYFIKNITSGNLIKMYKILDKPLIGNIAVKISTGEKGNNNYLSPNLIKGLVNMLNGTIVECNTAYKGHRNTTKEHLKVAKEHGFTNISEVDIMDSEGEIALPVDNGFHLKENYVGKHIEKYDSILMLSHFKGHPMGGLGGALKNMSIGVASSSGKANIHTAGKTKDVNILWDNIAPQDDFLESMADASKSVIDYMKGNIVYINVINNLSVDCDCVASPEKICMKDIGIVASLDPVAIDKACVDLITNSSDDGKVAMLERINRQHGTHLLEAASELKLGNMEYELINL